MGHGTLTTVRKKYKLFREWILQTHDGQDYLDHVTFVRGHFKLSQNQLEAIVAADARKNTKAFLSYILKQKCQHSWESDMRKDNGYYQDYIRWREG